MRMNPSHINDSNNLEKVITIKKKWNEYMLCLLLGFAWGLICQLAMVGTISLSSKFEISYTLWFKGIVVFFCSVVNTGGPLVVRSLILYYVPNIDTEVGKETEESMKSYNSSILVLFSPLGSNVSCESFVKISLPY